MTNVVLHTENRSEGRPFNSFPGPLTIHLNMAYCQKHFSGHILFIYLFIFGRFLKGQLKPLAQN